MVAAHDVAVVRSLQSEPLAWDWGPNLYAYAGGNPISNADPTGEDPWAGLNGGVTPMQAFGLSAQQLFWQLWNGNLWGGFHEQDGICTLPGCIGAAANANPGVLACCQTHDACYTTNQCNASSWVGNAVGMSHSCQQCNSQVMQCIGPAVAPKLPFFLQQTTPSPGGPAF